MSFAASAPRNVLRKKLLPNQARLHRICSAESFTRAMQEEGVNNLVKLSKLLKVATESQQARLIANYYCDEQVVEQVSGHEDETPPYNFADEMLHLSEDPDLCKKLIGVLKPRALHQFVNRIKSSLDLTKYIVNVESIIIYLESVNHIIGYVRASSTFDSYDQVSGLDKPILEVFYCAFQLFEATCYVGHFGLITDLLDRLKTGLVQAYQSFTSTADDEPNYSWGREVVIKLAKLLGTEQGLNMPQDQRRSIIEWCLQLCAEAGVVDNPFFDVDFLVLTNQCRVEPIDQVVLDLNSRHAKQIYLLTVAKEDQLHEYNFHVCAQWFSSGRDKADFAMRLARNNVIVAILMFHIWDQALFLREISLTYLPLQNDALWLQLQEIVLPQEVNEVRDAFAALTSRGVFPEANRDDIGNVRALHLVGCDENLHYEANWQQPDDFDWIEVWRNNANNIRIAPSLSELASISILRGRLGQTQQYDELYLYSPMSALLEFPRDQRVKYLKQTSASRRYTLLSDPRIFLEVDADDLLPILTADRANLYPIKHRLFQDIEIVRGLSLRNLYIITYAASVCGIPKPSFHFSLLIDRLQALPNIYVLRLLVFDMLVTIVDIHCRKTDANRLLKSFHKLFVFPSQLFRFFDFDIKDNGLKGYGAVFNALQISDETPSKGWVNEDDIELFADVEEYRYEGSLTYYKSVDDLKKALLKIPKTECNAEQKQQLIHYIDFVFSSECSFQNCMDLFALLQREITNTSIVNQHYKHWLDCAIARCIVRVNKLRKTLILIEEIEANSSKFVDNDAVAESTDFADDDVAVASDSAVIQAVSGEARAASLIDASVGAESSRGKLGAWKRAFSFLGRGNGDEVGNVSEDDRKPAANLGL